MARPITIPNPTPMVTNVPKSFREHMNELAKKISKEEKKVVTVSELMRQALFKEYPMFVGNYSDLIK